MEELFFQLNFLCVIVKIINPLEYLQIETVLSKILLLSNIFFYFRYLLTYGFILF